MREFYTTLEEVENGFKCTIRGQHLHITEDVLARLLHTLVQGYDTINFSDKVVILKLIFEKEDVNPKFEISASQLPAKMRLLHSIIYHILFP